ncbi:MAG: prepilin-type N-terminal cleavage/methylation domain-containing protein [bacterium]|nr:prepilin-type N-terminal cleavage/methylation domain-containing protein [bacterium]
MKTPSPTPFKKFGQSIKAGFSLIEVLVSVTILVVVVLIVGMIFQQTSSAWTVGMSKSTSQSSIRAIVGAIARDLNMAVDPTYAHLVEAGSKDPDSVDPSFTGENFFKISSSTLSFYIANDDADPLKPSQEEKNRGISFIEYSSGSGKLTRTETPIGWMGGNKGSETSVDFNIDNDASLKFEKITDFENAVKIKIDTGSVTTLNDYEIAVGSCGPDGEWGTDDDIKMWPDGEDK